MVWGYNGFRVLWFGVITGSGFYGLGLQRVQGFMVWGYNGFRVLWFGVITGSGFYGLGL